MREGEFSFLDMDEVEAIAEELEPGEGYHVIPPDTELLSHKECVSCHCSPVLVWKDDAGTEIWAHQRALDTLH